MTTSCEEMLRKLTRKRSSQVCLGAALGISKPSALLWFKSDLFTYGLGFLMLSMGLTLTIEDFKQVCEQLPLIDIGAMPSNVRVQCVVVITIAGLVSCGKPCSGHSQNAVEMVQGN